MRGVIWTGLSFAGSKLLVFASTLILARLLLPAEFGLVAFALLVISYLDTLGDLGVGEALIYQQKRPEQAANIAFAVGLVTGILWFAVIFIVAPVAAMFLRDPGVVPILRTLGWVFPITALGNTHDALLRRGMDFKRRLVPDFARALIKGGFSVAFALLGWGVWSLVWGQILGAAAATLALWVIVRWRPRFELPTELARPMMRFGLQIVAVNIVAAITHHVDYLIVGRMLGTAALGFYGLAYRVPELFITMTVWIVGKVAFPTYARLREDPPALQRAFLVTLRFLSLLTVPAGVGLAVLAKPLVTVFYGEKWAPAIPVLQALALAGSLRSLSSHAGDVYKATGRPGILVAVGLARAVALVPALIFGARFGIAGVAVAQMVVTGISTLAGLFIAGRVLALPVKSFLAEYVPAVVSSIAMAATLILLMPVLANLPPLFALLTAASLGGTIYVLVTWATNPAALQQARTTIASSFG